MEQNSTVGTRVEKNNLIVGALILLIGIVIGGVFGGGMMSNVDDTNLQGQAIESQEQYFDSTNDRNMPTDEQVEALKSIRSIHYIVGTADQIKNAFNFDPNERVNSAPNKNLKMIAESVSSEISTGGGASNNPNLFHFVCYMANGYGLMDYSNPGFTMTGNWWSNPSAAAGVDDCVVAL